VGGWGAAGSPNVVVDKTWTATRSGQSKDFPTLVGRKKKVLRKSERMETRQSKKHGTRRVRQLKNQATKVARGELFSKKRNAKKNQRRTPEKKKKVNPNRGKAQRNGGFVRSVGTTGCRKGRGERVEIGKYKRRTTWATGQKGDKKKKVPAGLWVTKKREA